MGIFNRSGITAKKRAKLKRRQLNKLQRQGLLLPVRQAPPHRLARLPQKFR